jgi:hypothetical protein
MFSLLCIIGGLWFAVSALFVLALAAAGRKPWPVGHTEAVVLKQAA